MNACRHHRFERMRLRRHILLALAGLALGSMPLLWWQASAVSSSREAFLLAATDCHDGRSVLRDLDRTALPPELQQAAIKAAFVPTLGCLRMERIAGWLRANGVDEAQLRIIENGALAGSSASLEYIATRFSK